MSQNQETIEARLCAYIDDELDAAGRADLEKHLAANPQHQRLIEELRLTSGLVRNLPRESAPPELAEGFNAHLERSVLLEGVSADVAAADLKVPRWPQLVAMAAITLLTVGLAIVVYFALPTGARPPIVQISPPTSNTAVAIADRDSSGAPEDQMRQPAKFADGTQLAAGKRSADEPAAVAEKSLNEPVAGAPIAPAAPSAAATSLGAVATAHAPASFQLERKMTLDRQLAGEGVANGEHAAPVVLVMHTDDPAAARKALVVYLVQQNIAWEPAPAPAFAATDALGVREAAKDLNRADVGGFGGAVSSAQLRQSAALVSNAKSEAGSGRAAAEDAKERAIAPAGVVATQPSTDVADDKAAFGGSGGAENTTTTQPAPDALKQSAEEQPTVLQTHAVASARRFELPAVSEFSVSCRLTAEQAEALRATLQQPGTSIDPLPVSLASDELSLKKDALAKGQESIAEQNALPSIPAVANTTPPSITVVPTTSPTAAPLADASAAQTPAPGAAPAAPADNAVAAQSVAAATPPPATQPAASAAPLLDVVIVVRPSDQPTASPAAATPTTQP